VQRSSFYKSIVMENIISPLKLGVIGLSPGNGHPYSWSAIFNGYNPEAMEGCGFPVIPRYLEMQQFPVDAIIQAKVTHVWAQEKSIAYHIAKSALIDNVVNNFTDMIGHVDGVLLARDDADTHLYYASPFLKAGVPIYIDKPLALNKADALALLSLQKYPGQLFSCSALRYASELQLTQAQRQIVGEIIDINAKTPKDWEKYSIHIIDPVLRILGDQGSIKTTKVIHSKHITSLSALHDSGVLVHITSMGDAQIPLTIEVTGSLGFVQLQFQNTFNAFKNALADFVDGIQNRSVKTSEDQLLRAICLLEAGSR
jgi:hypothetical protein